MAFLCSLKERHAGVSNGRFRCAPTERRAGIADRLCSAIQQSASKNSAWALPIAFSLPFNTRGCGDLRFCWYLSTLPKEFPQNRVQELPLARTRGATSPPPPHEYRARTNVLSWRPSSSFPGLVRCEAGWPSVYSLSRSKVRPRMAWFISKASTERVVTLDNVELICVRVMEILILSMLSPVLLTALVRRCLQPHSHSI